MRPNSFEKATICGWYCKCSSKMMYLMLLECFRNRFRRTYMPKKRLVRAGGGSNHSSPECDVAPAMGAHMASCMTKDWGRSALDGSLTCWRESRRATGRGPPISGELSRVVRTALGRCTGGEGCMSFLVIRSNVTKLIGDEPQPQVLKDGFHAQKHLFNHLRFPRSNLRVMPRHSKIISL